MKSGEDASVIIKPIKEVNEICSKSKKNEGAVEKK